MQSSIREHILHGVEIVGLTFFYTIALELYSIDTVKELLLISDKSKPHDNNSKSSSSTRSNTVDKTKQFRFYAQAILLNIINHAGIGIPSYIVAATLFCTKDELSNGNRIVKIFSILFLHAIMYYKIHEWMHSNPLVYRIHRFHHRFNTYVTPIAASAVTPAEYILAYILPFAIAMGITKPDIISIRMALHISSFLNVIVHTPAFESLSKQFVPSWMVSTHDHLEHHRRLTVKYASPTINIDYLVRCSDSLFSTTLKDEKVHKTQGSKTL